MRPERAVFAVADEAPDSDNASLLLLRSCVVSSAGYSKRSESYNKSGSLTCGYLCLGMCVEASLSLSAE